MRMYPKWCYHPVEGAKLVQGPEEHEALGQGWYDSPADATQAAQAAEPVDPTSREAIPPSDEEAVGPGRGKWKSTKWKSTKGKSAK